MFELKHSCDWIGSDQRPVAAAHMIDSFDQDDVTLLGKISDLHFNGFEIQCRGEHSSKSSEFLYAGDRRKSRLLHREILPGHFFESFLGRRDSPRKIGEELSSHCSQIDIGIVHRDTYHLSETFGRLQSYLL